MERFHSEFEREAFSSFKSYNCRCELNINQDKCLRLTRLSSNRDIKIQKVDKANSGLLISRSDDVQKNERIIVVQI